MALGPAWKALRRDFMVVFLSFPEGVTTSRRAGFLPCDMAPDFFSEFLSGPAEGEIEADGAGHGVIRHLQGGDAVITQPRRPTPDHDIAVMERNPAGLVAARQ